MNTTTFTEKRYNEIMRLYSLIYTMLEIDSIEHLDVDPNQLGPLYAAVSHLYLDNSFDIEKIGRHISRLHNKGHFIETETIAIYDKIIEQILLRDGTIKKHEEEE
tara:strand:+ start:3086 stop:3400 length:315 start_codon:yes stop_codon:yes gene_type:complete